MLRVLRGTKLVCASRLARERGSLPMLAHSANSPAVRRSSCRLNGCRVRRWGRMANEGRRSAVNVDFVKMQEGCRKTVGTDAETVRHRCLSISPSSLISGNLMAHPANFAGLFRGERIASGSCASSIPDRAGRLGTQDPITRDREHDKRIHQQPVYRCTKDVCFITLSSCAGYIGDSAPGNVIIGPCGAIQKSS